MTQDVEDLPELVERVIETAPAGTSGRVVLQLAQECFRYDLTPAEAWDREVNQ